jgi:hypothetical protein
MKIVKKLVSLEIPSAHLDELDKLVDFHFIIVTELLKNERYFEWYKKYLKKKNRKCVLLDNGMYEEGKPLGVKEYVEVIKELRPDYAFAPDLVDHMNETLSLTEDFIKRMKKLNPLTHQGHPIRIGVIPQGDDSIEVVQCYLKMEEKFEKDFNLIGISFLNNRPEVLKFWPEKYNKKKWHHMLGLYNVEEFKDWPHFCVSFDTVKPIKAAYHNLRLEELKRGIGKWSSKMVVENKELMYRNILELHRKATIIERRKR